MKKINWYLLVRSRDAVFLVVVGLMTVTGCGERNKSNCTEFLQRIVVEAKPTDFTLSQVIDSISFVALETNQNALIGSITKLLVTDSNIYILDNKMTESILVFNLDGQFLLNIGHQGKGPGEFIDVEDMCVDNKNQVVVTDYSGKKVLFFDNKGSFIKEIKTSYFPNKIGYLNRDAYVVTSFFPNGLINILTDEGRSNPLYFFDNPEFRAYDHSLSKGAGGINFTQYLDDTIYSIDIDQIKPKFLIDFGDRKMTRSTYLGYPVNPIDPTLLRIIPKGIRYSPLGFYENEEFIFFYFFQSSADDRTLQFCLFAKQTGESIFTEWNQAFDDLFAMHKWLPIIGVWKDKFIMRFESYLFLERFDKMYAYFSANKPNYLSRLEEIKKSITANSNPILVFVSFDFGSLKLMGM
jgi:hypothetical protein